MQRFSQFGPRVYYSPDEGGGGGGDGGDGGEGGSGGEGGEGGGGDGGEKLVAMPEFGAWIKETEYGEAPWVKDVTSFEGLAKRFHDTRELVGGERVTKPKPDDAEDRERFFNELGRPESVEGYDLGEWKPPENVTWDDDFAKGMLEDLHAEGATNDQVKGLFDRYSKRLAEVEENQVRQLQLAREDAVKKLKTEWGEGYDGRIERVAQVFQGLFGDDAQTLGLMLTPDRGQLGDHPAILRAMDRLGEMTGEDNLFGGKTSGQLSVTPKEAENQQKALELSSDFKEMMALPDNLRRDHELWKKWRELKRIQASG